MNNLLASAAAGNGILLEPSELAARLRSEPGLQLVDVREPVEFARGRIAGSALLPLGQLQQRGAALDRSRPVVCVCRSGKRSAEAAAMLLKLGFHDVSTLCSGLNGWEQAGLPVERDARAPWALERQVRLAAGLIVLASLALSLRWPPAIGLTWFVGAGLTFAGLTDWCGMGLLLAKAPWNRRNTSTCNSGAGRCCGA